MPAAQFIPFEVPLWPGDVPGLETAKPRHVPKLTAYPVRSDRPRGAVVVCPGGGYGGRAAHEAEPIALWLNANGISSFVVSYRVAPYRHPWPLRDAQRAVRLVRHRADEWGIDPQRVGILGFSAGGHLASTVGTHYDAGDAQAIDPVERESCRPDAMVLCYPVITLGPNRHRGSMVNLIGENPPAHLRSNLSNETQVTKDTPPAFIWHTCDDPAVPVENSLLFGAALAREHVPFELHIYRTGRHGLGLAQSDPHVGTWSTLCAEWLSQIGF